MKKDNDFDGAYQITVKIMMTIVYNYKITLKKMAMTMVM